LTGFPQGIDGQEQGAGGLPQGIAECMRDADRCEGVRGKSAADARIG